MLQFKRFIKEKDRITYRGDDDILITTQDIKKLQNIALSFTNNIKMYAKFNYYFDFYSITDIKNIVENNDKIEQIYDDLWKYRETQDHEIISIKNKTIDINYQDRIINININDKNIIDKILIKLTF